MSFDAKKLANKSVSELEAIYDEALGKLPSRAPIYLPTERVSLIDRITGVEHVRKIYQEDLDATYRPRLRALREKYKDHDRCFLIGNGPSLNRTDLSMLKDEVTFAVNGFFLKSRDLDWKPTFYLVEDHLVAEDRSYWINKFDGTTKLFPAYLGYAFPPGDDTIFYNHRPRKSYPHGFDFSMEADKITYTGCTVTFSMMQIAAYLGFKEIYLIGVDASYEIPKDVDEGKDYAVGVLDMKSDDVNHFDPNYFGKGFRWHDPQVEKMVEAYEEARRVLEGTPQTIYNATVGGMLEVFERRSFQSIFPNAKTPDEVERANAALTEAKYPKLLILDMTAMGGGSATGEVKATLFDGWPADRFLQVARHGKDGMATVVPSGEGEYISTPADANAARKAVADFEPDVILYRPVPNVPWLHDFAMETINAYDKPVVTWLMDDWPTELAKKDPAQWSKLGPDLETLLANSALNLSICDKMSEAFGERYQTTFKAFANGVNPVQWPGLRHHDKAALKMRYSGGLAPNMTLDSVLRVARAVERLAEGGDDITLEISTQAWWARDYGGLFSEFKHTTVETLNRSPEEYREWLSEADAVLIAYNFDQSTLDYVQYSMANKMPECLASGALVVAHGPRSIATVDYLAKTRASFVIEAESDKAVEQGLRSLIYAPQIRNTLIKKARDIAFDRHNIIDWRETLRAEIASVSGQSPRIQAPADSSVAKVLMSLPSPQLGLVYLAGKLLVEPDQTLPVVNSNGPVRDFVVKALEETPEDDRAKSHFQRVLGASLKHMKIAGE